MSNLLRVNPSPLALPPLAALLAWLGANAFVPQSATPFAIGVLVGAIAVILLHPLLTARQEEGSSADLATIEDERADDGESATIFVGNVPYRATTEELRSLFAPFGEVLSVRLMTDRVTRRPRGFGFVEMKRSTAAAAIRELDGVEFLGRELKVSEGRHRDRSSGD